LAASFAFASAFTFFIAAATLFAFCACVAAALACSSSVSSSPAFYFFRSMNLCRLLAAFSARPGSLVSQLAFNAFSLSSLSVS